MQALSARICFGTMRGFPESLEQHQDLHAEAASSQLRPLGYISMHPADLSRPGCPPSGSLCVFPHSALFCAASSSQKARERCGKGRMGILSRTISLLRERRGRRNQRGFLCFLSLDSDIHKDLHGRHDDRTDVNENRRREVTNGEVEMSSPLFSVPPASLCALPTSLLAFLYVFRPPQMFGAGRPYNCFTPPDEKHENRREIGKTSWSFSVLASSLPSIPFVCLCLSVLRCFTRQRTKG